MAKGTGTTRSVNSGNASSTRSQSTKVNGWSINQDREAPTLSKQRADAERIYSALSSSVEQAVESKVGDIRSGGGISGVTSSNGMTYSIIFRDGTTEKQIRDYMKYMDEGSKLYRAYQEDRLGKARDDFENWYNRMRGR